MKDLKIYCVTEEELTADNDTWWGLVESPLGYAVDFNYYINDYDEQNSMLYGCFANETGNIEINTTYCKPYNVDFSDHKWKERLIEVAIEFLNEIME